MTSLFLLGLPWFAACAHSQSATQARSTLAGLGDNTGLSGQVTFLSQSDGVQIEGHVAGLIPESVHGFHVHETGSCASADGMSAGGHFNPEGHAHGSITGVSHIGDLGNITADQSGNATINVFKAGATLGTDANSLLGRAVIVHVTADDLTSQPTGAAGARIACGVIEPVSQ